MENNIENTNPEVLAPQPEIIETKPKTKKAPIIFAVIVLLIIVSAAVYIFLNYTWLNDYFTGLSYEPTAEMAEIKSNLELTKDADIIFKASFPILEPEDDFNQDCDSHNSDISVLGCYANNQIYIYNIKSEEVPGILESTTAHELLHAVWSRLSGTEKARLIPLLESSYQDNKEMLEENLQNYNDENRLDELYVRIGTQAKNLSNELETHYARYFNSRNKIVEFYESYIAPFNELKEKINSLGRELEEAKQVIDSETAQYEARVEEFNSNVYSFNNCARTVNCFTESRFYARRAELVAEENNLNTMFENLNNKINEYNVKVEEYNSNIFKSNSLQRIINSNAPPTEATSENE